MTKNSKTLMWAATALGMGLAGTAFAGTLDDVKARGHVLCGTSEGVAGFSAPNDDGVWVGFDVDVCRAVSSAIFGDPDKVEFISLNSKDRFTALQSGEVDLLPRTTTFTLSRDTSLGIDFVAINYYDGQGIMVRGDLGLTKASELDGVTVCLRTGSTTELNLADYFSANGMAFQSVVFDKSDEIRKAYAAGRCDVMSGDRSQLAVRRSQLPDPDAHVVLGEVISKEPLAIAVRQGDDDWGDVVRWSFYAMVLAEEGGVTQANVDEVRDTTNKPEVKRLLGVDGEFGAFLGLPADWGYQIVKNVGNYGESFERNLGKSTAIGLDRGLNALWSDGGVMYVPPAN
ncbi:MAG: amino acid ABC transporter substrate-binding protein [Sulfitobacter sp.]